MLTYVGAVTLLPVEGVVAGATGVVEACGGRGGISDYLLTAVDGSELRGGAAADRGPKTEDAVGVPGK